MGSAASSAPALCLLLAVALVGSLTLGSLGHPVPVAGGENDRYAETAAAISAGTVGFNRFHPYFYPLLVSWLSSSTGDAFVAGRIVSSLAFTGLLFAVWWLAREMLSARRALLVVLLCGLSPHLLVHSVQVSSDITAAMFAAFAMGAGLRLRRSGSWKMAALMGLMCGAACATRFPASLLLLFAGWSVLTSPRRLAAGAVAGVGLVVGYLPHLVMALSLGHPPLPRDNWVTLVLKAECNMNYGAFAELDQAGLQPLWSWLGEWWPKVGELLAYDLGNWVESGSLALWTGLPAVAWLGLAFSALLFAACLRWSWTDRRAVALCAFAALHLLVSATFLIPDPRLLLPIVPLGVLAIVGAGQVARGWSRRVADGVAGLLLILSLVGSVREVEGFVASHPHAEMAVARELPERMGRTPFLLSTYHGMDGVVDYPVFQIAVLGRFYSAPRAELYTRIDRAMRQHAANAGLIGRKTRVGLYRALRDVEPPPPLSVMHLDEDVLLLTREDLGGEEVCAFEATAAGRKVSCKVQVGAHIDYDEVVGVAVALFGPEGESHMVSMQADAPGSYSLEFVAPEGRWQVEPTLLLADHTILRGPTQRVEAR
ncbi:MAG: glycosyltransferase family 39 protein [Planctomycetota bacterium]|nr:glycosyltransferase family 39 protein [Planctomycetota bacterium]